MSKQQETLRLALEALETSLYPQQKQLQAITAIKEALAQPEQKYRRGDRLLCLETDEYCVIHISGTDRQWVKFPDTHIGVYTNEQVSELFEKLAKETDLAQPEQDPVIGTKTWFEDGKVVTQHLTAKDIYKEPEPVIDKSAAVRIATSLGWEPKRTWVGLSDEERDDIILNSTSKNKAVAKTEAKLKEKNT